ncbi:hypothetical protein TMatcc_010890, partial [Talaromyces marneffei ATCC 18224]
VSDNPDIQRQSNEAVNQKLYFIAPNFTPHDRSQMMSTLHAGFDKTSSPDVYKNPALGTSCIQTDRENSIQTILLVNSSFH